jgi:hypothetical protein
MIRADRSGFPGRLFPAVISAKNLKNFELYAVPLIPIKPNPTRIFLVGLGFLGKITTKKFLEIFPGIREPGSGSPDRPDHKKYSPKLQTR